MNPNKNESKKEKEEGEDLGTASGADVAIKAAQQAGFWSSYVEWHQQEAKKAGNVKAFMFFNVFSGAPGRGVRGTASCLAGDDKKFDSRELRAYLHPYTLLKSTLHGHHHDAEKRALNALAWKILTTIDSKLRAEVVSKQLRSEVTRLLNKIAVTTSLTDDVCQAVVAHVRRTNAFEVDELDDLATRIEKKIKAQSPISEDITYKVKRTIAKALCAKPWQVAVGTVVLATTKGPCQSCVTCIAGFKRLFPGIRVVVVYPTDGPTTCEIEKSERHNCGGTSLGYPLNDTSGDFELRVKRIGDIKCFVVEVGKVGSLPRGFLSWRLTVAEKPAYTGSKELTDTEAKKPVEGGMWLPDQPGKCCRANLVMLIKVLREQTGQGTLNATLDELKASPGGVSGGFDLLLRDAPCENCRFALKHAWAAFFGQVVFRVAYLADSIPQVDIPAPPLEQKPDPGWADYDKKLRAIKEKMEKTAISMRPVWMIFKNGDWRAWQSTRGYRQATLDDSGTVFTFAFRAVIAEIDRRPKVKLFKLGDPGTGLKPWSSAWTVQLLCDAGVVKLTKLARQAVTRGKWEQDVLRRVEGLKGSKFSDWDKLMNWLVLARTNPTGFPSLLRGEESTPLEKLIAKLEKRYEGRANVAGLVRYLRDVAAPHLDQRRIDDLNRFLVENTWASVDKFKDALMERLPREARAQWSTYES